jgi:hypothetical protein
MLKAIIGHLNVTSKETLLATIDAASQPNPEAQQMAQQQTALQMELTQAQIAVLQAQSQEAAGRANKYAVEADLMPKETVLKYADEDKDGKIDDDFEKKIKLAEMLLAEERFGLEKAERQAAMNNAVSDRQRQAADQDLLRQMMAQQQSDLSQVTIEDI